MGAIYSASVSPDKPWLGDRMNLTLRCKAQGPAPHTMTFDHPSLVLELATVGSTDEPIVHTPNQWSLMREDGLVRLQTNGGVEDLKSGEERTRTVDLLNIFPSQMMSVATYELTFILEEAQPPVRSAPVRIEIGSGPHSVTLLFPFLNHENHGLRLHAQNLLTRMTGQTGFYNAEADAAEREAGIARWRHWWETEGSALPWDYEASHATMDHAPKAPPPDRRGKRLGGVVYQSASLSEAQKAAIQALDDG